MAPLLAPLVVGFGGALGAIARFYGTEWVRHVAGDAFPWGTLAVNLVGSFALGAGLVLLPAFTPSPQARQFVAIGVLGSFTTFSTFSYEAVSLARSGEAARAVGYAAGSVVLGVAAVLIGAAIASTIIQSRG